MNDYDETMLWIKIRLSNDNFEIEFNRNQTNSFKQYGYTTHLIDKKMI